MKKIDPKMQFPDIVTSQNTMVQNGFIVVVVWSSKQSVLEPVQRRHLIIIKIPQDPHNKIRNVGVNIHIEDLFTQLLTALLFII